MRQEGNKRAPDKSSGGPRTAQVLVSFEDGGERQNPRSRAVLHRGGPCLPSKPVSRRELAGGFDSRPPPRTERRTNPGRDEYGWMHARDFTTISSTSLASRSLTCSESFLDRPPERSQRPPQTHGTGWSDSKPLT